MKAIGWLEFLIMFLLLLLLYFKVNGNVFESTDNSFGNRPAKLSATSYAHRAIFIFDGPTLVKHTNADKKHIEKLLRHQSMYRPSDIVSLGKVFRPGH